MTRPSGTRPPLPPSPPDPPFPRHTPWLPEPRPTAPGPVSASAMVVGVHDWLGERLLDQRVVALAGELDDEAVNRSVAALALLDAAGDDPIRLRLSGVNADLVGVPVHATALGTMVGPAVALLAVADHRVVGPHVVLQLREPRAGRALQGRDVEAWAAERARLLHRLQVRLAEACARPVEEIAADMAAGRILGAQEAKDYGLVDACEPARRPAAGPIL
jgi:ATP-dependent Clp protease, protease subunit